MRNKAHDHSKYRDWIDPASVQPYERNAKQHTDKQIRNICNSIRRFGWQQDTVITADNVCVIGHGRRLAALKLGCEMPYHRIDKTADELTDKDIRELRIADNQTNAETGFDFDIQTAEIADLDFEGFDFDFGDGETGGGVDEYDIVEDEAPEPPEEPTAKRGDIWQLGRHRLMCGDSTSKEDVDRLTNGEKMRLMLTDPPYNVNLGSNPTPTDSNIVPILNDSMPEDEFIEFLTDAFRNAERHMEDGGGFYVWHTGLHHTEFETAIRNIGNFKIHEELIWVKSSFILGRNSDYQWMHENCVYGWKEGAAHYFTDSRAESTVIEDKNVKLSTLKKEELIALCEKMMGMTQSTTILRADKPMVADLHPTVKPQSLIAPLIRNSSQKDWNVLDLFGGSGSTLIACERMDRNCFIMELDPHYVDVIIQRWENLTGEKAVLLNG